MPSSVCSFVAAFRVLVCATALAAAGPLAAQAGSPLLGRWDLTVQDGDGQFPSWLEVSLSGTRTLVGRFVDRGGSARPIAEIRVTGDSMRFGIPPQWEREANPLTLVAALDGERLSGTITAPNGRTRPFSGVRAPALRREAAPEWDTPRLLFDGTDMAAWTPLGGTSQWRVVDGVLTNTAPGANLATRESFTDFRLQLEFRYPPGGNSGVYLRGRYEVQIEDSGDGEPQSTHLGGVYGFLVPNQNASLGPNRWQRYDITLIGRRVTVVLNGQTIIADQTIPGITGGALDSNEALPGPIYLQGDHTAVEYRNIRLTPARKP